MLLGLFGILEIKFLTELMKYIKAGVANAGFKIDIRNYNITKVYG